MVMPFRRYLLVGLFTIIDGPGALVAIVSGRGQCISRDGGVYNEK